MARTWLHLTSSIIVCALICFDFFTVDAKDHHPRPMLLPLQLTSRNHSQQRHLDNIRRHLQQSGLSPSTPNARMRLYDDLLSNGSLSYKKKLFSFFPLFDFPNIEFFFFFLNFQLLYYSVMDWNATSGIRSYRRHRKYCNLRSLLQLCALRQASGSVVSYQVCALQVSQFLIIINQV